MRAIVWSIRIVLFFVLLGFAIKNNDPVVLHFFSGREWSLPLAFIILVAFAVGALLGVTATITSLLRQRHEISRLRRQLDRAENAAAEAAQAPDPF